jgi:hypothetical protein
MQAYIVTLVTMLNVACDQNAGYQVVNNPNTNKTIKTSTPPATDVYEAIVGTDIDAINCPKLSLCIKMTSAQNLSYVMTYIG